MKGALGLGVDGLLLQSSMSSVVSCLLYGWDPCMKPFKPESWCMGTTSAFSTQSWVMPGVLEGKASPVKESLVSHFRGHQKLSSMEYTDGAREKYEWTFSYWIRSGFGDKTKGHKKAISLGITPVAPRSLLLKPTCHQMNWIFKDVADLKAWAEKVLREPRTSCCSRKKLNQIIIGTHQNDTNTSLKEDSMGQM